MARQPKEKRAQMPSRPPQDAIDTEQKAREESELEEHQAPRFWETDEEHQRRLAGEPVDEESDRAPESAPPDEQMPDAPVPDGQAPPESWNVQHVTPP